MPYVDRDGARIWWDEAGQGAPVLLITGLGYPSDTWWRMLPHLTDRYRTLRLDNRGVGRTGVGTGPYSIEGMAADALAVLAAAGERSAHVVGSSMGGIIAQELALQAPERVRSLVLLCTLPAGPHQVQPEPEVQQLLTARGGMTPREAAELAIPFIYSAATPRERIDEDIEVRLRRPTEPAGYLNQLAAIRAYAGSYPRLGGITAPTLVVHGSADRLVPPGNAELIARAIPGARLELVDGASHILGTDAPDRVPALVRGFLDDQP